MMLRLLAVLFAFLLALTAFPPTVALISNAQSGSLNLIAAPAPAAGAVPSGFQSLVPARRIDRSPSAPPVPLTRLKPDAPAARAGAAVARSKARQASLVMPRTYTRAPASRKRFRLENQAAFRAA